MNELQTQAEEGVTITFDEAAGQAGVEEEAAEAAKNAEELQKELQQKLAENEDQIIGREDYLGNLEQQEADAQARGEAIGNALASGLNLAMAAITTQDNPIISFLSVINRCIEKAKYQFSF